MKTAQIWQSIEALNDEAEAALKESTSLIRVIKSSPLPPFVLKQKIKVSDLTVFKSSPAPPTVNFAKKHKTDNTSTEPSLVSATMDEIAAAIDRASKMPKTAHIDQGSDRINDDFRKDLLREVEKAVRTVLAAELPQLVRYAVSVSMHELLTASKEQKTESHKLRSINQTSGKKGAGDTVAKNPSGKNLFKKI